MIAIGINSDNLESTICIISDALALPFRPHESSFQGGDYYSAETAGGSVILQSNCDLLDTPPEPFEADWPIHLLVLYFHGLDHKTFKPYVDAVMKLNLLEPTRLRSTI